MASPAAEAAGEKAKNPVPEKPFLSKMALSVFVFPPVFQCSRGDGHRQSGETILSFSREEDPPDPPSTHHVCKPKKRRCRCTGSKG